MRAGSGWWGALKIGNQSPNPLYWVSKAVHVSTTHWYFKFLTNVLPFEFQIRAKSECVRPESLPSSSAGAATRAPCHVTQQVEVGRAGCKQAVSEIQLHFSERRCFLFMLLENRRPWNRPRPPVLLSVFPANIESRKSLLDKRETLDRVSAQCWSYVPFKMTACHKSMQIRCKGLAQRQRKSLQCHGGGKKCWRGVSLFPKWQYVPLGYF